MVQNWDPETHKFYAYLDPSDYTNPNVKGSLMWIICYQDDTTETRHEIYQLRDKNNTIIRAPHFLSSTHDTAQNIRLWFTESQKIVEEYGIEKILDREPGVKEYFPNFQVGHRFRDLEVFNRNYQNMLIHQYGNDVIFHTLPFGRLVARISNFFVSDKDEKAGTARYKDNGVNLETDEDCRALYKTTNAPNNADFMAFGYKICATRRDGGTRLFMVKLGLFHNTRIATDGGAKHRCDRVCVLSIAKIKHTKHKDKLSYDLYYDYKVREAPSIWNPNFIYRVGKIVREANFVANNNKVCVPGIHFYHSQERALLECAKIRDYGLILNRSIMDATCKIKPKERSNVSTEAMGKEEEKGKERVTLGTRDIEDPLGTRDIEDPLGTRDIEDPLGTRDIEDPEATVQCIIEESEFPQGNVDPEMFYALHDLEYSYQEYSPETSINAPEIAFDTGSTSQPRERPSYYSFEPVAPERELSYGREDTIGPSTSTYVPYQQHTLPLDNGDFEGYPDPMISSGTTNQLDVVFPEVPNDPLEPDVDLDPRAIPPTTIDSIGRLYPRETEPLNGRRKHGRKMEALDLA
jgi:hypothetical protein